ncbi:universal stress protein [Arsenicicoccus dermatophilus]|uniref:universal stress protein n=1 Tax=Arsenicicoccus dermatophilus TaxID=1076331 RepID=UPI0039174CD3
MTICLAYAPTAPGRAALAYCAAEAAARGSEVLVVNVTRDRSDGAPVPLSADEAQELAAGLGDLTWRLYDGPHGLSGADEVLTAVEEEHAELVVIGVTGRSHVQKRIVSNTTRQVLLDAPCDVLAVRADHPLPRPA